MVRRCISRIQLHGATVVIAALGPLPIVGGADQAERRVRLGQQGIERERSFGC